MQIQTSLRDRHTVWYIVHAVVVGLVLLSALYLLRLKFHTPWQHFTDQAVGFLEGRLHTNFWTTQDLVEKDGRYYWPNGPFPAVLLTPFVGVFGERIDQSALHVPLVALLFFLCFYLARQVGYSHIDSLYLAFALLFSTMIYAIVIDPSSWLFSQTVCLVLSFAALVLWKKKEHALSCGILMACVFATRPTAAFLLGFFLLEVIRGQIPFQEKRQKIVHLLLPMLISGVLLLAFNYVRFGNPFDNGYKTNNIGQISEPQRALGVFTPLHIPMNVYWYFLSSFKPVTDEGTAHVVFPFIRYSEWGLSLFIVAPFFLHSLRTLHYKQKAMQHAWIVVGVTTLVLLSYFNTGWYSFGPRYFADAFPLIYWLTLFAFSPRTLSLQTKTLIVLSAALNSYLLITTGMY